MQINFGELELVEKTFTREGGAVRTQNYNGIKFRRYQSTKGKKAAEEAGIAFTPFTEEQFVISNKAWEALNLDENALAQVKHGSNVLLLVLEDQDQVKPHAKFCRKQINKDGSASKKGKMFSNEFLAADLVAAGVLNAEGIGNQFIGLEDVTSSIQGMPAHVKGVYKLVPDTSVSEEDAAAEAGADANSESDF